MRKLLIFTSLVFLFAIPLMAQVKVNLSLMADKVTYLVSLVPETEYRAPYNLTGSAHIVVRVRSDRKFLVGKIGSMVKGVEWLANAYVENPLGGEGYTFVSFVMNEKATKNIEYQANQEIPLFTFTSHDSECLGEVNLLPNDHPMVKAVVESGYNITNNLAVLGKRGNAITGVRNGLVNCNIVSSVKQSKYTIPNLQVFPVPASHEINIKYFNAERIPNLNLQIQDLKGDLLQALSVIGDKGAQALTLPVESFPEGVLIGKFTTAQQVVETFRFMVIK